MHQPGQVLTAEGVKERPIRRQREGEKIYLGGVGGTDYSEMFQKKWRMRKELERGQDVCNFWV